MEAMMPNSTSNSLPVIVKAAKPAAVVEFVRRLALPIREIILDKAFTLFPCSRYSPRYLLRRKMEFSTAITIKSGGKIPVSIVILKPNNTIDPSTQEFYLRLKL